MYHTILFVCCEEDVRVENKEDQWMGVTVQSQGPGGKIVASYKFKRIISRTVYVFVLWH